MAAVDAIPDKKNNHPERRTMPILRIVVSLLGAALAVLLTATPAFAHTELKSSDPADGVSLSTVPTQVTLTFEEAVTLPQEPIGVTGPDGSSWTVGPATITGASVTAPVEASGPAGQYTLRYTVIADDGDDVKGTVRFTLSTAASATTAPETTEAQAVAAPTAVAVAPTVAATPVEAAGSSGTSGWVWFAVAVVVAGVLAGLWFARSRRSSADRTP